MRNFKQPLLALSVSAVLSGTMAFGTARADTLVDIQDDADVTIPGSWDSHLYAALPHGASGDHDLSIDEASQAFLRTDDGLADNTGGIALGVLPAPEPTWSTMLASLPALGALAARRRRAPIARSRASAC